MSTGGKKPGMAEVAHQIGGHHAHRLLQIGERGLAEDGVRGLAHLAAGEERGARQEREVAHLPVGADVIA
jgi:hypothetical protein